MIFDDGTGPGSGLGPDFERWLEETYDGDEHAKAAARADLTAMADHHDTPANGPHESITTLAWRALRAMGIRGGRMLVIGQDPEILAGLPANERRLAPGDTSGFYAPIPDAAATIGGSPHAGLTLRLFDDDAPDQYDVVLSVPPHVDVTLHRPRAATARRIAQTLTILGCLKHTEPGGYVVALASRDVLDDPDPQARQLIADRSDLVGAIRLPAGALRPGLPGNDACVDLLVLRRHFGHPVDGMIFGPARPQLLAGHLVLVNEYYLVKPRQVLGQLTARTTPWGPPEVTVEPTPGSSPFTSLSPRLDDIVDHAHAVGLTAQTRAALHSRLREAQRDDPDQPIPYAITAQQDLGFVRRQIARLCEGAPPENANPSKPTPGPPLPRRDGHRFRNPGPPQ